MSKHPKLDKNVIFLELFGGMNVIRFIKSGIKILFWISLGLLVLVVKFGTSKYKA